MGRVGDGCGRGERALRHDGLGGKARDHPTDTTQAVQPRFPSEDWSSKRFRNTIQSHSAALVLRKLVTKTVPKHNSEQASRARTPKSVIQKGSVTFLQRTKKPGSHHPMAAWLDLSHADQLPQLS